jgi:hypothetical protein
MIFAKAKIYFVRIADVPHICTNENYDQQPLVVAYKILRGSVKLLL